MDGFFDFNAYYGNHESQQTATHSMEHSEQDGVEEQSSVSTSEGAGAEKDSEAGDEQNEAVGGLWDAQSDIGNDNTVPTPGPGAIPSGQPPHYDPITRRPTRAHPRAATIPGMTPGRKRCDTCYDQHVSIILM